MKYFKDYHIKRKFHLLIGSFIFLSSCTTSSLMTSGISYKNLTKIDIVNPLVDISSIESGNQRIYNKLMSDSITSILVNDTKSLFKDKNINLVKLDTSAERKLYNEIFKAVTYIDRNFEISKIKFNETMDSILLSNNIDYAMFIMANGFFRLGNNYINQFIIGVFTGYHPIKSTCHIRIMIIDRANKNIAFYRKTTPRVIQSLDSYKLNKEVSKIFNGYIKI